MLSLHCIIITVQSRGMTVVKEVPALRFVTRDKSTTYEMLLKQVNLLSHLIKELLIWPPSFTKLSLGIKSLEVPRGAENKYNHLWT